MLTYTQPTLKSIKNSVAFLPLINQVSLKDLKSKGCVQSCISVLSGELVYMSEGNLNSDHLL